MACPQSQDYNEAIQNPASSFGDGELRGGQAVTNALGMPMPRSGNFADVYEFHGASGQKWALKCFTRQIPDLQERYFEISKRLVQAKLPFTVDFTYLPKGIRVHGEFYPILKMHWVEGFLLNEFVRDNLDKPALLEGLGQIWLRMSRRLTEAGIAHADLQHGNVILIPGNKVAALAVKLIDYDGMWVPALAQKKSGEVGHPAYQHPERLRKGTYGVDVDRLPVLAIACALRCLAAGGKALWDKYDNGDNLLFRETDLRNPAASGLFKELWRLNDAAAHNLTGYLVAALTGALGQIPLLQDVMSGDRPRPLSAADEQHIVAILEAGAAVNRSVTALQPKTRNKLGTLPPPQAARASPDWDFLDRAEPSPWPARKSASGIATKVWFGFLMTILVLSVGGGMCLWLMQKGEPAKTPDEALAKNERKEPDRLVVKPQQVPGKKKTKQLDDPPVVNPDPMPAKKKTGEPDRPVEIIESATPEKEIRVPDQPGGDKNPDPNGGDNRSEKIAVPDQTVLEAAEHEIRAIYKDDFAKKKPSDRKVLANRLFQEGMAAANKKKQAYRFVCLREARDLAAKAFDFPLAFQSVAELDKVFLVNLMELKTQAIAIAGRASTKATTDLQVGEIALGLLEEVKNSDAYEFAPTLLAVGRTAGNNAKNPGLRAAIANQTQIIDACRAEHEKVKGYLPKLEANPKDPEANFLIGRFHCFQKNNWEKGLPLLANGSDQALAALAKRDMENPEQSKIQTQVGDRWWELASKEPNVVKANLQSRARVWYRSAYGSLTGQDKSRIEERLKFVLNSTVLKPGLEGEYFSDKTLKTKVYGRLDPQINFRWERSPAPGVPDDHFSCRWQGWLLAPRPGKYKLIVHFDDGCRVFLDGQLVIDAWTAKSLEPQEKTVFLSDWPRHLRVEHYYNAGTAIMKLLWWPEGQLSGQPIPAGYFYHISK